MKVFDLPLEEYKQFFIVIFFIILAVYICIVPVMQNSFNALQIAHMQVHFLANDLEVISCNWMANLHSIHDFIYLLTKLPHFECIHLCLSVCEAKNIRVSVVTVHRSLHS